MSGWETTPEPISAFTPYPREARREGMIDDSSYLWSGVSYPQVSSVQSLVTQMTSVYTMGRPLLSTGVVSGSPTSHGRTTRRDVQDMDVIATHGRIWWPTSLPSWGSQGLLQASVMGGDERRRHGSIASWAIHKMSIQDHSTCGKPAHSSTGNTMESSGPVPEDLAAVDPHQSCIPCRPRDQFVGSTQGRPKPLQASSTFTDRLSYDRPINRNQGNTEEHLG